MSSIEESISTLMRQLTKEGLAPYEVAAIKSKIEYLQSLQEE